VEAVQMGQQTMVASSLGNVSNFLPELSAMDLPFAFSDRASVEALFEDEEFYQYLKDELATVNFYLAGVTFQGFRTLSSNIKVESLADMKGLKIRVMENPTPIALWNALGANPTPIAYAELYTALQQGVVDAQENPISLDYSAKFYEQQKYIVNTNHQAQIILWLADLNWYNSLPDEYKAVFDEGCKKLVAYHNGECDAEEVKFLQEFQDYGCEYIELSDEARDEIRETAMTIWPMLQESAPDFYAHYVAALERSQK
ncbi:MAG: TRAP transporter substrate-binding protein, partial [Spirochaetales bacterium]|nr:TRAP transporter substrate-binding protein [Spirochaetales bacterium]